METFYAAGSMIVVPFDWVVKNPATAIQVLGAAVTAIATFFLWRVTKVLAIETKRMADQSSQPNILASFHLNQWAMNHMDITVQNVGNAPAFDIKIKFDPPLKNGEHRDGRGIPLQSISLLAPGQALSSYLTESHAILDRSYTVSTSWKRSPETDVSEMLTYQVNLSDFKDMTRLGAESPLVQIASEAKKLREVTERIGTQLNSLRTRG